MSAELRTFMKRACNSIKSIYNTTNLIEFLMEEVKRKRTLYPFWEKKVRFSYTSFYKNRKKKLRNKNRIENKIKKSSRAEILKYFYYDDKIINNKKISDENFNKILPKEKAFESQDFFFRKFWPLFEFFMVKFFPFKNSRIKLVDPPIKLHNDMLFKVYYTFTDEEIDIFRKFKKQLKIMEPTDKIIELFIAAIVHCCFIFLKKIIDDNFVLELICSNFSLYNPPQTININTSKFNNFKQNTIVFLIGIRQKERILSEFYFKTQIFHFAEFFGDKIPLNFQEKLRTEKDLIYLLALDRYKNIEPYIVSTLGRIYAKCCILYDIKSILDFLNFVASRIEDSRWDNINIITEVIDKSILFKKYKKTLIELFQFINSYAMVFSTLQSNNRPQIKEQYNLFLLYLQLFFLDQSKLFFEDKYKKFLNNYLKKKPEFLNLMPVFNEFIQKAFLLYSTLSIDIFFKNIFNKSLAELNNDFFHHFLTSLNRKFFVLMDELNLKYLNEEITQDDIIYKQKLIKNNKVTFEIFIDFIIKALYHMIKKVFLRDSILDATENFYDKRGRYSPKRLALRTLELIFFKEMPISDNNWMNYNLSRYSKRVKAIFEKYIQIPDQYFFSRKKLVKLNLIYSTKIETKLYLEEWLIQNIMDPFLIFFNNILENLKSIYKEGQIKEKQFSAILNDTIFKIISKGIISEDVLEDLETISISITEIISNPMYNLLKSEKLID
ncbi:MAG: hypothetical protein ACTSRZ_03120 [Promethearchaeota archaeon]